MRKNKVNYKLVNILVLMIIVYIVIATSYYWSAVIHRLIGIVFPFLLAFVFAYVMHPFVKKLEEKGVRRSLALTTVIVIMFLLLIGLISLTIPVVYEQLISFTKTITQVITDVSSRFDLKLGGLENSILEALNNMIQDFGTYISTGTIDILGKSVNFLTNFIVILVVGIYLLVDMDKIRLWIKNFLRKYQKKWYHYVKQLDVEMGNYFHGLAIFMIIQFFEYSFLFFIVGHPNWLLLGILACVTTVIPYFGGIFTNIVAVVTASAISTPLFISTLIITLIFPNIDGYLISPTIYGKTNNINPVVVIMLGGFFSSFFGIIGMAIALPAYLIIRCTWNFFNQEIKDKIQDVKESIDD
ncbi:MAG: AI-2E family transporter [bacterium]|nr:AI-2E family transporter [bacterium]